MGRDTDALSCQGVARAAVETVAENTCDGVIAPLFYLLLGGGPLAMAYKAVNTLDSMVGYRSEAYLYFGRVSARADDAFNFLPARISAWAMILSAFLLRMDGRGALRIYRRDRHCHKSPNSAQTESVCAGALGLQLAGPAWYGGVLIEKPVIGDKVREIVPQDIASANLLMAAASWLCLVLGLAVWAIALMM